jgi:hypothetical protein
MNMFMFYSLELSLYARLAVVGMLRMYITACVLARFDLGAAETFVVQDGFAAFSMFVHKPRKAAAVVGSFCPILLLCSWSPFDRDKREEFCRLPRSI